MDDFFKYPRTRHCYDTGNSVSRDDLLLTATEFETTFLQGRHVTVEEKVDGANLGLSIDPDNGAIRAQNRSHYVNRYIELSVSLFTAN
jgi:atypical dual specificity phosphatase